MGLCAQEEKEFRECFDMFDEEGEDSVEVKELSKMMTLLGWDPTQSELNEVVKKSGLRRKTKSFFRYLTRNFNVSSIRRVFLVA